MVEPIVRRPGPKPRRYHVPGAGTTLGRLIHVYVDARRSAGELVPVTAANTLGKLRRFADHAGWDTPPARVERADVERFLRSLRVGPASRRSHLSNIRTFWRWLILEGHATADPTVGIPKIRVPKLLPRALRPADVTLLFDQAAGDPRLVAVLSLMGYEGLRAVEIERLDGADIDWAERVFVVNGKGAHQRRLPLSTETEAALTAYLVEAPPAAVDGPLLRLSNGRRLLANYVSRMVSVHMTACGVPGTGHALRHSMAAQMLKGGANIRAVQQALGHDNIATTSRYLSFMVDDLREAMERRSYGEPAGAGAVQIRHAPQLDAIGPLIDAVADLTAMVRQQGRIEIRPAGPPARAEVQAARTTEATESPAARLTRYQYDMVPCPDCGKAHARVGLHRHRVAAHGYRHDPQPAGCKWYAEPHLHTPVTGRCICPICEKDVGGAYFRGHVENARHTKCPDCDRSFIRLDIHRRSKHPVGRSGQLGPPRGGRP